MLAAAAVTVLKIGGYGLMAVGVGTTAWLVLSFLKPQARGRAVIGMACALGLAVGTVKLFWSRGPENASAAPASGPQSPPALMTLGVTPATQPTNQGSSPEAARFDRQSAAKIGDTKANRAVTPPAAAKPAPDHDLGDVFTDHTNGYSIRFPAGWSSTEYTGGDPWFIEVSNGKSGLISIGFSPFPSSAGIDQLKPTQMAARLAGQRHTVVQGHGVASIDGQKCLWFKYTGPIKSSAGDQAMTVIHYYVPLHDGRMLELRLAAAPDAFATQAPILRKSAASVKLLPL